VSAVQLGSGWEDTILAGLRYIDAGSIVAARRRWHMAGQFS
jgi:hypothetical protein